MIEPDDAGRQPRGDHDRLSHLPSIVKGAAVNFFGTALGKVLTFAYTLWLSHTLATREVGVFFLGTSVFQFLSTIFLLGLDSGMRRFVSIHLARGDHAGMGTVARFGERFAIALGIGLGIALAGGSGALATLFGEPLLRPLFLALAPAVPFSLAASVLLAATQGLGQMQHQVIVRQIVEPAVRLLLVAVFFLAGLRYWGVVIAFVSSLVLGGVLAWLRAAKTIPRSTDRNLPTNWKAILLFSLPQTFSRFLFFLIMWTDTLMLGYLGTSEQVGLYSIASRAALLGVVVFEAFEMMFASQIAGLFERNFREELVVAFKSVTKWGFLLGLPLLLLMIVLPGPVLQMFGDAYPAAGACLLLLAAGQLINTATGPVSQMLVMLGRPWINLANNLAVALLNLILNVVLIPHYGIVGAATATMTSVGVLNVVRLVEVRWLFGWHPYRLSFAKPLVAAMPAAGAAIAVVRWLPPDTAGIAVLVAAGGALVATYLLALLALGFDVEDRYILSRLRARLQGLAG